MFTSYTETPDHTVTGFGKTRAPGRGDIKIVIHMGNKAHDIILKDALHVPTAPFNLISVGRMTTASCKIKFKNNTMSVFTPGLKSHKIMQGIQTGENLYKVHITKISTTTPKISKSNVQPTLETSFAFATAPTPTLSNIWGST